MDAAALKTAACAQVDLLAPRLLALSHALHANPEPAFEERHAAGLIAAELARSGLPCKQPAYGLATAIEAQFGTEGPNVAVLSEYDALPGLGHACGHNMIAAIGLGAALALQGLGPSLPGRVRYLGTPAEERGCGKELLARAGAFDGIDAAMMLHPAGVDAKAIRTLALAELHATFSGRAAHASVNPQGGINALDALVLSYQAIAQLRQHLPAGQFVHGIFTEAGRAPNIVPERGVAHYYVRAASVDALLGLKQRVQACLDAAAVATGCTVQLGWSQVDYLDMRINEPLADAFQANMAFTQRPYLPYTALPYGTTDMANVSHRVPALHPLIACSPMHVVIHDPEFARWARGAEADRAIVEGAKGLAMTALDFMTDAALQRRVREAFAARPGSALVPPIPTPRTPAAPDSLCVCPH